MGSTAGDIIQNINLRSTKNSLAVAGHIHEFVSMDLGDYSLILHATANWLVLFKEATPTDREIMLQQFKRVHLRFDAILNVLEESKQLISEISDKVELHTYITLAKILIMAFQRILRSPMTEINNFRSKCRKSLRQD